MQDVWLERHGFLSSGISDRYLGSSTKRNAAMQRVIKLQQELPKMFGVNESANRYLESLGCHEENTNRKPPRRG
jgi:hypothetical protein